MTDNRQPNVIVPPRLVIAIAKWAYQADDRPRINCVMFGAGEMVAVDGHRLVRVPIECDGARFGIRPDILTAAVRVFDGARDVEITHPSTAAGSVIVRAFNDGGRLSGVDIHVPYRGDREFPPIDSIMPTSLPVKSPDGYCFNPEYLAAIHEVQYAAGAQPGAHHVKVTGWSDDALGGMLFEGHGGIRYVIMPGRP